MLQFAAVKMKQLLLDTQYVRLVSGLYNLLFTGIVVSSPSAFLSTVYLPPTMSKTYDLLSQCFVNPHDHLGATKWNCQDPTCGHLRYTGNDHFHLGYFPLSRELGVLKERFVKNVDEVCNLFAFAYAN